MTLTRRDVFATAGAAAATLAVQNSANAQSFDFKPNQRYPDASVEVLDPSFAKYRLFSSTVEQVATGMRWAEGPVWFGDGRYILSATSRTTASCATTKPMETGACSGSPRISPTAMPATARAG
jgi:hypothetical protein